jgi:hypothetical protein
MTNKTKAQLIALMRTDRVTGSTAAPLPKQPWRSTSLPYSTRPRHDYGTQQRYGRRTSKWI